MGFFALQESVDLGEIMYSLCYLPTAGRMTLTVIKCRNLKAMDITGSSGNPTVDKANIKAKWPRNSIGTRHWAFSLIKIKPQRDQGGLPRVDAKFLQALVLGNM